MLATMGSAAPATPPAKAAASAPSSGAPIVINIDNPSFRKLAFAAPTFFTRGAPSPAAQKFAKDGPEQLGQLLQFSGYFNIVAEAAYRELLKKAEDGLSSDSATALPPSAAAAPSIKTKKGAKKKAPKAQEEPQTFKQGMAGIDLPQWKAVGVETLTLGELTEENGLTLSIKTIDIHRGEVIVGKKYTGIATTDTRRVMRRYADAVLQAYTGKPGIFNSKLVIVGRKVKSSNKQIYTCDFDGTNVTQLTSANVPHLSPEWSKDGRYITYTSYEDKNPDLFIYDSQTGKHRKLSGRPGLNSGASWSPNNRVIAFTGSQDGEAELYLVHPDGSNRRLFIKGDGLDVDPAFSPDGNSLAFVSGRFGNPHIFVANLKWDGDEPKVVSDVRLTYAGWYNATPAWSPDGDKIAFAGYDKDIDRFDIFMVEPKGQNMERLTLKAGDNESPTWSPNGQLLMFQSNRAEGGTKGAPQLFIMNRDGSGQRVLDTGLYGVEAPNWSLQFEYD